MDHKDYIILRLEAGDDRPVTGFIGYRLLVDFRDDGAFGEVVLVSKGSWTNAGDHNAIFDSGLGCYGLGDR